MLGEKTKWSLWKGGKCAECGKMVREKRPVEDYESPEVGLGIIARRHKKCVGW